MKILSEYVIQVISGLQRPFFFLSHFDLQVIVLLFLSILKKTKTKQNTVVMLRCSCYSVHPTSSYDVMMK